MSQGDASTIMDAVSKAASQMNKEDLEITVREAVQCILCTLYGVTSKVKHEVRPIDSFPDLIRALSDPHVRKGLGLIIEILRSLGRCLEAAEMAEKVKAGSGPVCSLELPCYLIAYGVGSDNNA